MQNIDVRFVASANFAGAEAQLKALQARVEALQASLAEAGTMGRTGKVDAKRWQTASAAVNAMSDAYRAAAASSGLLTASQLKVNSETERYTQLLQKNKLGIREMLSNQKMMKKVYQDQLRMQRMTVTSVGIDKFGREISDITVPNQVPKELDTIGNRLKFIRRLTQDASVSMINWGKNTQWAGRQLTVGLTMPMAMFAAAAGKMAYDVDKQLTRIVKVYDSTLGSEALSVDKAKELGKVRADSYAMATEMAKKYGSSINDVLGVEAELAATGLNGNKLISSTAETMRVAALGELDMQTATDMTVALQSAFRDTIKTSKDLGEAFDYMNAIDNATSLSIKDMAEAVPRAGSALASLGVTVKQLGVLMVSMKENGIPADEAANALKSATTRILNVVPEAEGKFDSFFKSQKTGYKSVQEISDKTGGNLYEFLQELARVTKGMDNLSKQKALAKLFGTYQYNRLNAALRGITDAMFGLGDANDQVVRAMKTAQLSDKDLAAISANEIAKKAQSASGRFNSAWQQIRVTMSKVGQDFLPVGTEIVHILDSILKGAIALDHALPGPVKSMGKWAVAIAAIAGPGIMLTGLMANLMGYGLKMLGLGPKFAILNRAQNAAKMQAEQTSAAYVSEAESVRVLTAELQALAAAQGYATGVANAVVAGGPMGSKARGGASGVVPMGYRHDQKTGRFYDKDNKWVKQKNLPAPVAAWHNEQKAITREVNESVKAMGKAQAVAESTEVQTAKMKTDWSASKVSSGIMGAALVGTMVPGAKKFSEYILTAALAMQTMSIGRDMAKGIAARRAASRAAGSAAGAAETGLVAGLGTKMKSIFSLTKTVAKGFGWWGLGITAASIAAVALYKKMKAPEKQQEALNKSADNWAKALGGVYKGYDKLHSIESFRTASDKQQQSSIEDMQAMLEKDKKMKDVMDAFKGVYEDSNTKHWWESDSKKSDRERFDAMAMQQYNNMLTQTNLSSKDAAMALQAMFQSAGMSASDAEKKVKSLVDRLGELKAPKEFGTYWKSQIASLINSGGRGDKIEESLAKSFTDALADASNAFQRTDLVSEMATQFNSEFNSALGKVTINKDAFKKFGIEGNDQIHAIAMDWMKQAKNEMSQADFQKKWNLSDKQFTALYPDLNKLVQDRGTVAVLEGEKRVTDELIKQLKIKTEIATLNGFKPGEVSNGLLSTKDDAMAQYKAAVARANAKANGATAVQTAVSSDLALGANAFSGMTPAQAAAPWKEISDKQKLVLLNQVREQVGLERTTNLADGMKEATKGTADAEKQHKKAVEDTTAAMEQQKNVLSAMRTANENIVGAAADWISNKFASMQQGQMDALNASIDAEGKRFDNQADHIDKVYQRRIDAVNNVIKAEENANDIRQRLFEAEKTRMNRLAEAQNRTIDFNMALNSGKLDEAAKIMNDAQAKATDNQMEDEQKRADARLDVRRKSLEKKIDRLENSKDAKRKAIENAKERWQAEADIRKANLQKELDDRKANFEMQLDILKTFTPRTRKEMADHLEKMRALYGQFGGNLKLTAGEWGRYINDATSAEMHKAVNRMVTENNWAGAGFDTAMKFMNGMLKASGMSKKDFEAATGLKWPTSGDRPKAPASSGGGGSDSGSSLGSGVAGHNYAYHTGGVIGVDPGGRTGFSGMQSAHNEVTINAQRGEYMMSKAAHNTYGTDFMNAINSGSIKLSKSQEGRGAPGGNMLGGMAAVMANTMANGFGNAFSNGISKKIASAGMLGALSSAKAGKYGGTVFDAEQLKNAGIIADVGRGMGMSKRDIVIGLMTAMQESMLRNINYGDRDSLGLFQQRPSQGWGTPEQVTNPRYAATKFFEGLRNVKDRNSMPLTYAAQAVQRSAFPTAYAKWEDEARAILSAMNSKGGPGGGFMGVGGGANSIGHAAINWAIAHLGDPGWAGLCQKFVRTALGAGPGFPTAISAWYGANLKHPGDRNPPAGVPAYFSAGSNGLGHVALTVGSGGRLISTDWPHGNTIGYSSIGAIESAWGRKYLGWTGDINGKTVYPGLRKGGEIRWDDTIARLHRGETVLTAPLTKQFKDNVANGGGNTYHMTIDLRGATVKEDIDIKKAVIEAVHEMESKVGRKRQVK